LTVGNVLLGWLAEGWLAGELDGSACATCAAGAAGVVV
jgi:hypothetical protein